MKEESEQKVKKQKTPAKNKTSKIIIRGAKKQGKKRTSSHHHHVEPLSISKCAGKRKAFFFQRKQLQASSYHEISKFCAFFCNGFLVIRFGYMYIYFGFQFSIHGFQLALAGRENSFMQVRMKKTTRSDTNTTARILFQRKMRQVDCSFNTTGKATPNCVR